MLKKIIKSFINRGEFVRTSINLNDRKGALHRAWGHIFSNHLYGDYVEFGVYHGDSFLKSINEYKKFKNWLEDQKKSSELWRREVANKSELNNDVYFHGLDTFDGMPENVEENFIYSKGTYKSNFENVDKIISKDFNNYKLYRGLFSENKNQLKKSLQNKKVVIANFDCDIYQSTVDALDIVSDHFTLGSILMFDDYHCFNSDNTKGQRKAFFEFKQRTNYTFESFFSYHFSGKCFLITGKKT